MTKTATKVMDVAEKLIRKRGYQGFAFREVASQVGIKSASVHYHFPTKEDLCLAIIERYNQEFSNALSYIDTISDSSIQRLESYVDLYRNELQKNSLPLCLILGSSLDLLPESVIKSLRFFHELNLKWLEKQFNSDQPSIPFFSTLNGALFSALIMNDDTYFEKTATYLLSQTLSAPEPPVPKPTDSHSYTDLKLEVLKQSQS